MYDKQTNYILEKGCFMTNEYLRRQSPFTSFKWEMCGFSFLARAYVRSHIVPEIILYILMRNVKCTHIFYRVYSSNR